jgi:hypothetical protein
MISQIITQTCRQPGLSMVYTELLDFDGDELYITAVEETIGRTFEDVMLMFETSAVVGVRYASGQLKVNPPMQTVLSAGDAIIAISADDDTIITRRQQGLSDLHINADAISPSAALPPSPERILVLGWNERGRFIVRELDQYVRAGTTVHVHDAVDRSADIDAIRRVVKNMSLTTGRGSTTAREDLDALNVLAYDSVIVLADTGIGVQEADARTLMTLIHLRDMTSGTSVNIVTEMLDERNRSLAATDRIGDFIISNTIMSLLLTQIAETPDLHAVFRDLFDADGSELYLKPSRTYVLNDRDVTWATVVKAAGLRGEIAIGTKSLVDGEWRVALNIPKSSMCRFREGDMVIVVAED